MLINLTTKTIIVFAGMACFLIIGTVMGLGSLLKGGNSAAPSALSDPEKTEATAQQSTGGNSQTPANLQTFIIYKYNDPMAGMEAFRLLIPKGWQADGGVTWVANPALPAQFHFRFYNPGGSAEFDIFPTQAYFWTDNQLFLYTNPPGSLRFGTLVAEPIDLRTAFTNVIIPNFRGQAGDLRIVESKEVAELAALAKGAPTQVLKLQPTAARSESNIRKMANSWKKKCTRRSANSSSRCPARFTTAVISSITGISTTSFLSKRKRASWIPNPKFSRR
jgi:hypothetical protein